jgi:DNA-binding CsgD family transcriptional regulator
VAAFDDIDQVEVFDNISRLVDKSLIVLDDDAGEEPRYRLLETLRAYALTKAVAAAELDELRRIHATWWLSWLEAQFPLVHTDPVVDQVEQFHDNFKAALDWGVHQPVIGLRLLAILARPWQSSGRHSDAEAAIDQILTEQNAQEHPQDWLKAATASASLLLTARGYPALQTLMQASERLARELGDQNSLTFCQWFQSYSEELSTELIEVGRATGDRYLEATAMMMQANTQVLADPAAAASLLDSPQFRAVSQESSYFTDFADRTRALAALSTGDLAGCIQTCRRLSASRSTTIAEAGIYTLTRAALLSANEAQLTFATEVAERRLRGTRGTSNTAQLAANRLALFHGRPSVVDPDLHPESGGLGPIDLYVSAREAIDAGASQLALATVRAHATATPYGQAVLAMIEAEVETSEDRWHQTLQIAAGHRLLLLVVDALEGLAVCAGRSESWAECLRLAARAQRLRDECGYRWRFPFEHSALTTAINSSRSQLGPAAADVAEIEGRELTWPEAVQYARRARGERKRPRQGWAALTPTELQVVELIGEGLTNQQIAERLIMGRATVKTHLEHIFAKLDINSRTQLAAQVTRRNG